MSKMSEMSEPKGRGDAWTEERGTSDEGRPGGQASPAATGGQASPAATGGQASKASP